MRDCISRLAGLIENAARLINNLQQIFIPATVYTIQNRAVVAF